MKLTGLSCWSIGRPMQLKRRARRLQNLASLILWVKAATSIMQDLSLLQGLSITWYISMSIPLILFFFFFLIYCNYFPFLQMVASGTNERPSFTDLVRATHTRPDGTFVDYRAEELVTQAELEATQLSNTDGSPGSPSSSYIPSRPKINKTYLKVSFIH